MRWDETAEPLTLETLNAAIEKSLEPQQGYEPYVFVGTLKQCRWYAKQVLRCTDEQIDARFPLAEIHPHTSDNETNRENA